MVRSLIVALCIVLSTASSSLAQDSSGPKEDTPPAWQLNIEKRQQELVQQNGEGTDAALRAQLLSMRNQDQAARGFIHGKQTSTMTKDMIQKLPATDDRLTQQLQQIIKQKGWPTISLVGLDASNGAMLILTHTRDHAWQHQLLPELQSLADAGKIDASPLALLIDKELVAEGKLQRYGSQFKFINGKMAMYAVEDPSHLDELRAKALLPPMDVYKQMMSQIYHLALSDDVVMATAPDKQ